MIRKASKEDVKGILKLLQPYVEKGIVLPRTEKDILSHLSLFYVAEDESGVTGVISHYKYSNTLMEIRSLAVRENLFDKKIGSALVKKVIQDLRAQSPDAKIFSLTLAPGFFLKCGFSTVEKETLPEKIWKDCSKCIKKDCCDEIPMVYNGK